VKLKSPWLCTIQIVSRTSPHSKYRSLGETRCLTFKTFNVSLSLLKGQISIWLGVAIPSLCQSKLDRQVLCNRYRDEWFNAFTFSRTRPPVQVSNASGSKENTIQCQI
jgi:hypothetical protein